MRSNERFGRWSLGVHLLRAGLQAICTSDRAHRSPPFAPASQHPSHEPDYMQLDGTAASRPLSPQDHASTVTSPGEGRLSTSSPSNHVQAAPGASGAQQTQRPSATRLPTSSQDDIMSVSRSKRLVSGYMFGPPVDPDTHEPLEALETYTRPPHPPRQADIASSRNSPAERSHPHPLHRRSAQRAHRILFPYLSRACSCCFFSASNRCSSLPA